MLCLLAITATQAHKDTSHPQTTCAKRVEGKGLAQTERYRDPPG